MKYIPLLVLILSVPLVANGQYALKPTYADVSCGQHTRNVLDFWQAEGAGGRPLLVYIHGGGWTKGDKSKGA